MKLKPVFQILLFSVATFAAAMQDAVAVTISDVPMAVKNTAKSNIMFTLDNSGGMDVDVLLTTYNSMYYETGVAPSNNPYNLNGNFYLLPSWYREWSGLGNESLMLEGDLNSPDANHWRVRSNAGNPQYYNPFKVYQPWPGTNNYGNLFANANAARALMSPPFWGNGMSVDLTKEIASITCAPGNYWTAACPANTTSFYWWNWAMSVYPPQAHTYLSNATPPADITASGGRYYDSKWYPATYYNWVDSPNFVSSITVNAGAGGSGYASLFSIPVSGGGGAGATADVTAVAGVVTSVRVTAPGSGYTSSFTLLITAGGGTGATVTVNVGGNGVLDVGEGVRYEIKDPNVSCTATVPGAKIPGCAPVCAATVAAPFAGCHPATYPNGNNYAQEIQNFANWFQYYRTPMLALQGALGKQIETLGSANVGVIDLRSKIDDPYLTSPSWNWWSNSNFFGTVQDMSVASNVTRLRNNLYAVEPNLSDWRQPIHERVSLIKDYFMESTPQNGHNTPKPDGTPGAPIQYACQQNFNVIATPGYLNENGPGATGFKNYFTGKTPTPIPTANFDGTKGVPYADTYSDTLADWTGYTYSLNLRTDLTAGQVPLTPSAHEDNPNPHLTTYVMSPGAQPTLQSNGRMNGTVLEKLNPMTTDPWTITPSIAWPQPAFVDQTTVDDLWHAAVNGRGKFVNDTDIYGGLKTVLNDIFGRVGASAAVAVSNANISPGDNFSYASSYNSGNWTGDLQSYPIDLVTGQASTAPRWVPSAQVALDSLVQTSTRTIVTFDGSTGIPFQWASLGARQSLFNSPVSPTGVADGLDVLKFLRGDRLHEGTRYRTRGHILGDIINAEPVILRDPQFAYTDPGYAAYKVQYRLTTPRTNVVFQPANDGMVHVFAAATGAELWAYVPGVLLDTRLSTSPTTTTSKLVNLSLRSGFTHLYMVDGTPAVGDVDFGKTGGTTALPDWRALLVGGLNKGGFGYYALDVTAPDKATATSLTALTETEAAAKVLWEFPTASTVGKANVGFSYGKPYITKTKAAGWVVLVTSGYNNGSKTSLTDTENSGGDGLGHLFVLNAQTGALIKDIPTTAGSPAMPSGLGQIVGYSDNAYQDNTVKLVYGGDLNGNVWRFDLSGAVADWKVDLLAQLVDAANMPQPITTTPALAISNGKRMVFVGTGQYLSDADVSNTQTQSMYGLIDSYDTAVPLTAATITPLRSSLNQQQFVGAGASKTVALKTAATSLPVKGWFVDFDLTSKERVVTDPAIAINSLVFTTNVPSSADPCKPGGSSWIYNIDFATGGMVPNNSEAGKSLGNSLASRPILVKLTNGDIVSLVRKSDATTASPGVNTGGNSGVMKRVSWREIKR